MTTRSLHFRALSGLATAVCLFGAAVSASAQCSTVPLSVGTAQAYASPGRYTFAQQETFWAVCAVRPSGSNWNLDLYDTLEPNGGPSCFSGPRASTGLHDGYVDFIAGDFSTNLLTSYYVQAGGSGSAQLEWDTGTNDNVMVVGTPRVISFTPTNVVEVRDIQLDANTQYRFQINALGGLQARAYLVNNPNQQSGFPRFVERDSALTWTNAIGSVTTDSAGFYGIVITNENAGTGSASVLIGTSLVDAGDVAPVAVPRIARVMPNPLRGRGHIAYDLPRAARIRIDLVDLAGRFVAGSDDIDAVAGPGQWEWDGRGRNGAQARAGVYFARLMVDGRPADRTKLLVLP